MLDRADIEAVVVDTPHYLHAQQSLAALERGLHVLVCKPMALTSGDAWAVVDAAERANRVLMVYCTPMDGLWRTAKAMIEDGAIGPPRQINAAEKVYFHWFWDAVPIGEENQNLVNRILDGSGVPREFFDLEEDWVSWKGDPDKMGGGSFVDTGIYIVVHGLWLAGAPPSKVVAFTESAGLPVEIFVNAQARLANGVLFSMTFADAVPEPMSLSRYEPTYTVVGDERLLFQDREGVLWLHRGGDREKVEAQMPDTHEPEAFVSTILDGTPNLSPGYLGAWAVEFIEATYRSAAEGRIVQVASRAN
jgi:predicted dehydrogenase